MRLTLATIAFLCASSSFALREEIVKLIDARENEFRSALRASSSEQTELILQRWTDLLLQSPLTLGMPLTHAEVFEYLKGRFVPKVAQESKLKKGKKAQPLSANAEQMVKALVDEFQGIYQDGRLELTFECGGAAYRFPFEVEAFHRDLHLLMRGVSVPFSLAPHQSEDRCLDLVLNDNSAPSLLEHINTIDAACPVPAEHAGNCLLSVADRIAQKAGRHVLRLSDASNIRCKDNRERTSLRRLRMYKGQPGWYEGHAFVLQRDSNAEKTDREKFTSYTLDTLVNNLPTLKASAKLEKAQQLLKKRVPEFKAASKENSVAAFMVWLWDKDCAEYIDIDTAITDVLLGSEFSRLYPAFALFEKRYEH